MKVLIADDEPIARRVLRDLLEEIAGMEVVGEAATGIEAVELVVQLRPDVILLDLNMPEMGGFAVARNVMGRGVPVVIYVTAFDQHALQAFETGAVDYLLKPVRMERLIVALGKARVQLAGIGQTPTSAPDVLRKISGRLGEQVHLLDLAEVIALQADGEVVYILTAKGRFFATGSLRSLEARLAGGCFRRVHRKTLINVDHMRTISPLSSKRWMVRMSNGMEVVVSKRLAGLIRDQARG